MCPDVRPLKRLFARSPIAFRQRQEPFVSMRGRLARYANMIQLSNRDSRRTQAILDRLRGKSGAVLDAIESLFFDGGDQLAVFDERGRRITVICIYAEDVHRKYETVKCATMARFAVSRNGCAA